MDSFSLYFQVTEPIAEGRQGKDLKAETHHGLLAHSLSLSLLSHTSQDCKPTGLCLKRLGPPTLVNNQDGLAQTDPQAVTQLGLPSQLTLSCVKLVIKAKKDRGLERWLSR